MLVRASWIETNKEVKHELDEKSMLVRASWIETYFLQY